MYFHGQFNVSNPQLQNPRSDLTIPLPRQLGGSTEKELNMDTVKSLENTMTLDNRNQLDLRMMWGEPNTYDIYCICYPDHPWAGREGEKIRFSSSLPSFALPDPRFLAVRAARAKIIRDSGLIDELDDFTEDPQLFMLDLRSP
ncbi:hypothetical protein WG66_014905 [Moniliophthora roreri]|nr:hypothetical protein WG66_014905 [Moniliophthora roreri]